MRETDDDMARLQQLLDDTYARAGGHLKEIHTDYARLTAAELVARYTGMKVAVVATVSADGRPFTAPVDSFLYRGEVCFGTAQTALRARHLAANPAVSATWVDGESDVVTVHGTVRVLDLAGADAGFDDVTREHYGTAWGDWPDAPAVYAIVADRMFAADMSRHAAHAQQT